jgi:site-specific DNA-methyltransferase (adenine-specific)
VQKDQLYYGDNLTVLREHIKDESVDLIYLDPPFNSPAGRPILAALFAARVGSAIAQAPLRFLRHGVIVYT